MSDGMLETIEATTGEPVEGSVIWLHGLGADGHDFEPVVPSLDVPGPIGRNVTDIAILLSAMTGTDDNDPATAQAAPLAGTDFTQFLDPQAAAGLKVGISLNNSSETESAQARAITEALLAAGVDVVEAGGEHPFEEMAPGVRLTASITSSRPFPSWS